MRTSSRLDGVKPSITFEIDARAKQLRADGHAVIGLAAGEPDFAPADEVAAAAVEAIRDGRGRYTPVAGLPELRTAICTRTEADLGLRYDPSCVVVSSGAKQSLFNALFVLCDPGDQVIIPVPYWTSYPEMARALGIEPVLWSGGDPSSLATLLTDRTRALVLNSPNNPTGSVHSAEWLRAVADVLRSTDAWVISDDIYAKLVFDGAEFVNLPMVAPDFADRTIVVNGMSKAHCMTGWRVGYAMGPAEPIRAMATVQGHVTSCANTIAQVAATAALTTDDVSAQDDMVEEFARRARTVHERLVAIPGVACDRPAGAFYVFPRVDAYFGRVHDGRVVKSAFDLARTLLEDELVAVIPGEAFGDPRRIRISYATSMETLTLGLDRIESFLGSLSAPS